MNTTDLPAYANDLLHTMARSQRSVTSIPVVCDPVEVEPDDQHDDEPESEPAYEVDDYHDGSNEYDRDCGDEVPR